MSSHLGISMLSYILFLIKILIPNFYEKRVFTMSILLSSETYDSMCLKKIRLSMFKIVFNFL